DFDFDHQRFRENASAILQSALGGGVAPTNNTIGFIPDTDRYTGTARFRSRLADRAVLEGGLQLSVLERVDELTHVQRTARLRDAGLPGDHAGERLSPWAPWFWDSRLRRRRRPTAARTCSRRNAPCVMERMARARERSRRSARPRYSRSRTPTSKPRSKRA